MTVEIVKPVCACCGREITGMCYRSPKGVVCWDCSFENGCPHD